MLLGMDTSYLLRLLTGQPADLAEAALMRYQEALEQGDAFFINDIVVAEAYYALQHHYGKTKEESINALRGMALDESIAFSEGMMAAIDTPNLAKASPGFIDRILVADYRARGQVTLSCEKSFKRLADVEVVAV